MLSPEESLLMWSSGRGEQTQCETKAKQSSSHSVLEQGKSLCVASQHEKRAFRAAAGTRCCVFLVVIACAARAWTFQRDKEVEAGGAQ